MTAMTMTKLSEPRKFEIQYEEDRNFKNENVWIISETTLETNNSGLFLSLFPTFFTLNFGLTLLVINAKYIERSSL